MNNERDSIINNIYELPIVSFPYDKKEYDIWCTGDRKLRDSLLGICGYLGKYKGVFYDKQFKQHYPEIKYAVYLIEKKLFEPNYIRYETYRLSLDFIKEMELKTGRESDYFMGGHALLSKVFSNKFFTEFDKLIKLNADKIERGDKRKIAVDLCAINFKKSQMHFYEIKRCEPGPKCNDKLKYSQRLFMGFVTHILSTLGDKAFYNKKFTIKTKLVFFVDEEDFDSFKPQPLPKLKFQTPEGERSC